MADVTPVGNALCLDLTNTVNARPVAQRDRLATVGDARSWARDVQRPIAGDVGEAGLTSARALREVVYRVFQPLAHGRRPARGDLDDLLRTYATGAAEARLRRSGDTYAMTWPGERTLESLGWEVAASAMGLLANGPLTRLGECPSCGWLFLDTSKNGLRRWCSMATCGSRDKARRYYDRNA